MKDHIDNIVQFSIKELSNSILYGEFMIGIEPIHEFVKFWLISNYIQTELNGESQSLLGLYDDLYMWDARKMVYSDDSTRNDYEKLVYQYHNLNREKQKELKKIKAEEASYKTRRMNNREDEDNHNGNPERFKSLKVFNYQKNEFMILKRIKDKKHDNDEVKAGKTYKRLINNAGKLKNITYKDLIKFESILKDDIETGDYAYKNIQYYKLEKRMGFQLLKCVAAVLETCLKNDEEANDVLSDLVMLNSLPLINDRQKYALKYPELNDVERSRWRFEVKSLFKFIQFTINLSLVLIKELSDVKVYDQKTLTNFQNIFADKIFENSYTQRKDFSASTFKTLMVYVDELNNGENKENEPNRQLKKAAEKSYLDDKVKDNIRLILDDWLH